MKKVLIASIVGLALQISVSEAQTSPTREVPSTKSQEVEPPPPPPPPPATPDVHPAPPPPPPTPPTPPVPPVPAETGDDDVVSNQISQDRAKMMMPDNEKGFVLTIRREQNASVVVIRKDGYIIRKINMQEWLANNKKYEEIYGKLPPPPPPKLKS